MRTKVADFFLNFGSLAQGFLPKWPRRFSKEAAMAIHHFSNTQGDSSDDLREITGVHQLFEIQARKTPRGIAVTFEENQLTYQDLNEQADRVAGRLRDLGVGSEVIVGIYVERSVEMLVGLLGILKAGGAYVPMDPAFPRDRIAYVLEDANPGVLLTQTSLLPTVPQFKGVTLCLDDLLNWPKPTSSRPPAEGTADDLAYVLYTSGSTGKPKGVQIQHRSFLNFLLSFQREPGLTSEDVLLAVATLTFDMSCLDMFLPLSVGARLVIAPWETAADGSKLKATLARQKVTAMQATPTTWRLMIEAGWMGDSRLKVLCGGEALPASLAAQLLPRCGALWNLYGPTETTIYSSICRITSADAPVSIGRPIANTSIHLLDECLKPVFAGQSGEIYIGGDGLARGYLHRPELTAERFVANPLVEGSRLYRTGDLGRYLPDGTLECLGRIDHQVKLRGFRIELGEIEATLAGDPAVQQAVVTAYELEPGDKRLAAYIMMRKDSELAPAEAFQEQGPDGDARAVFSKMVAPRLREFLHSKLPDYMVPSTFVMVDAWPLTPNGKLDRNQLPRPEPAFGSEQLPGAAPKTNIEKLLAEVWAEVLNVQQVGITDDFFDLGGHSLLAVRMVAEFKRRSGKTLTIAAVFQAPTIEKLSRLLELEQVADPEQCLVAINPNGSKPPFFCISASYDLTHYLGQEQPFYGLDHAVFQSLVYTPTAIDEAATRVLRQIRAVKPKGPYYLGGHCLGGVVAFDIAQQLHAAGEEVKVLVLLDPESPVPLHPLRALLQQHFLRYLHHLREVARLQPADFGAYVRRRMTNLFGRFALRFRSFYDERARQAFRARAVQQSYVPKPFAGRITLFLARSSVYRISPKHDPRLAWSHFAKDGLDVHEVPGEHDSFLHEPEVGVLGRILRHSLEHAQAEEQAPPE